MNLQCLIVEDQPAAQALLKKYIDDTPHLDFADACASAASASGAIGKRKMDLIFLDLHLPGIDGFSFLRSLPAPPLVIVTTADPDQALKGFDLNIVDYLLKPFSYERFLQAVSKAMRLSDSASSESSAGATGTGFVFARIGGELRRIDAHKILYIESEKDYAHIICTDQRHFAAESIKDLTSSLASFGIVRVHKSFSVNIHHIQSATRAEITVDKIVIPLGRAYKEAFLKAIKQS